MEPCPVVEGEILWEQYKLLSTELLLAPDTLGLTQMGASQVYAHPSPSSGYCATARSCQWGGVVLFS